MRADSGTEQRQPITRRGQGWVWGPVSGLLLSLAAGGCTPEKGGGASGEDADSGHGGAGDSSVEGPDTVGGTWTQAGVQGCADPLPAPAWTDQSALLGTIQPTTAPHPQSSLALDIQGDTWALWTVEAWADGDWGVRRWSPDAPPESFVMPEATSRVLLRDIEGDGLLDMIGLGPTACIRLGASSGECILLPQPEGFALQDAEVVTIAGERRLILAVTATVPGGGPGPLLVYSPELTLVDTIYFEDMGARLPYFVSAQDYDRDGILDLYACNDFGAEWGGNVLLTGTADGGFVLKPDTGLEIAMHCMGVSAADFDADGQVELFITGTERSLLLQEIDGSWYDLSATLGMPAHVHEQMGWGSSFVDIDNDGAVDLLVGTSDHAGMGALSFEWRYLHQEDGRLVERGADIGLPVAAGVRAVLTWDLNGDGVLDLLGADFMRQQPWVFLSTGCTADRWLAVDAPSATRVQVVAGGITREAVATDAPGFAASQPARAWFGLGGTETVDTIRLDIPGVGQAVLEGPIPARQVLRWTP